MHDVTGLPWWVTIVMVMVALRTALLPFNIKTMEHTTRLALAKPELEALQAELAAGVTPAQQAAAAERARAVYKKHGIQLKYTMTPFLIQMPVFVSFFFALRGMAESFPSFATGGAAWFTNLAAPDPTYALPVATAATMLATIELGGDSGTEQTARMKNIMRGMAALSVPVTLGMPNGLFVYWITSNLFSLAQTGALKLDAVRAAVGIPKPPPLPVQTTSLPFSAAAPPLPPPPVSELQGHSREDRARRRRAARGAGA